MSYRENKIVNISYNDLTVAATSGKLVVGKKYKITDYRTAYAIEYYDTGLSTYVREWRLGDVEQLIVTASTSSSLEAIAESLDYPDDVIHYNLLGNPYFGSGLIPASGYGAITYREYPKRNIAMFQDWRQIKFRLYDTVEVSGLYVVSSQMNLPPIYTRGENYIETTSFPVTSNDFANYQSIRVEGGSRNPQLVVFLNYARKAFVSPNQDQVIFYDCEDIDVGSCSVIMPTSQGSVTQCYFAGGAYYLDNASTTFFGGGTNFYSNGYNITSCNVMSGQTITLNREHLSEMVGYPIAGDSGYISFVPSQSDPLILDSTYVGKVMICNDGGSFVLPATPTDGMAFSFLDTNAGASYAISGNGNYISDPNDADGGIVFNVTIPYSPPYNEVSIVWVASRNRWVIRNRNIGIKLANTIKYTPEITGTLVSTNVQDTLTEIDTKKIDKTAPQFIAVPAETTIALGSGAGTRTVDLNTGSVFTATATGACAWDLTNGPNTVWSLTLIITNGGLGAQTWKVNGNARTPKLNGGSAITYTSSGVDIIEVFTPDGGTTLYVGQSYKDAK